MTDTAQLMPELAQCAFDEYAEQNGLWPGYNLTNSNLCHVLTLAVTDDMQHRGLEVCRELHETQVGEEHVWHYLLSHRSRNSMATPEDTVTDLNPWHWRHVNGQILHGPRREVMGELQSAGAPEWAIALRGISTLSMNHDPVKYRFKQTAS